MDVHDLFGIAEEVRLAIKRRWGVRRHVKAQKPLPRIIAGLETEGKHTVPYWRRVTVARDVLNLVERRLVHSSSVQGNLLPDNRNRP